MLFVFHYCTFSWDSPKILFSASTSEKDVNSWESWLWASESALSRIQVFMLQIWDYFHPSLINFSSTMWIMLRPNESWLPATWLHALSPHGRRFLPNRRLSRDAKEGTDGHFRLIVDDTKWHATNFQMHIELFLEGSTEGKASRGKNCETTHNAIQMNTNIYRQW